MYPGTIIEGAGEGFASRIAAEEQWYLKDGTRSGGYQ
jgi:hypothetical protein